MKRRNHTNTCAASVLLFLLPWSSHAKNIQPTEGLKKKISSLLLRSQIPPQTYGIEIRTIEDNNLLYSVRADQAFNPASGIKILTAVTALSKFGPAHHFETVVSRSGKDLCIVGGGDPSLVSETLWLLVQEIKRKGVLKIAGDLILDSSLFGVSRDHMNSFEDDSERAFTAPVNSLSVNFNSLTIHADPMGIGKPPLIQLEPDLDLFVVSNHAKSVKEANRRDLEAVVIEGKNKNSGKLIVDLSGKVSSESPRTTIYRSMASPETYFAHLFLSLFKEAGGEFTGRIRSEKCPSPSEELVRFPSKPLAHIVYDLNKYSNNFIAEMLVRAIGNEPTPESGIQAIRSWLNQSGISAPEFAMENGSGLSHNTRISAQTLVAVIRKAATDLRIGPEFLSSLGIMGVDGTVKRRMKGVPAATGIRAKSGQLSRVVSLTGVVESNLYHDVAFSFLFNDLSQPAWQVQKLEEEILQTIIAPSPE